MVPSSGAFHDPGLTLEADRGYPRCLAVGSAKSGQRVEPAAVQFASMCIQQTKYRQPMKLEVENYATGTPYTSVPRADVMNASSTHAPGAPLICSSPPSDTSPKAWSSASSAPHPPSLYPPPRVPHLPHSPSPPSRHPPIHGNAVRRRVHQARTPPGIHAGPSAPRRGRSGPAILPRGR